MSNYRYRKNPQKYWDVIVFQYRTPLRKGCLLLKYVVENPLKICYLKKSHRFIRILDYGVGVIILMT